jgi:alkylation response protein AidB-like acyl-CoA dehydrogenase
MSTLRTNSTDASASKRLSVSEILEAGRSLLPALAGGAADRERLRHLPHESIRQIADAGLLTLRVPLEFDGPDATIVELFSFIVDLAAADSNVAQSLRPGFLFVEQLRNSGDLADQQRWFPRVLAGDVFGNAGWERGAHNGEVRARITTRGRELVANGTKSYSTGALFADWVSTIAIDDRGERVAFTVPTDRGGLRLVDDWDGFGQRLTASGTTELKDVVVHPTEMRRQAATPGPGRSPGSAIAQLFLAAVLAGIARNALDDATVFARDHARPITHAGVERSVDDPYVRQTVGTLSARAFAAEAAVLRAAASVDAALGRGLPGDAEVQAAQRASSLTTAALDVARAQYCAAEAALENASSLFEVGGASTTLAQYNLDRHWRNARTVANHNPRAHKASVLGAWHLTGAEPPTSGLF